MPKFLCVKGILFFSFWQSLFISILVAAGVITKLGPYTDSEHISLALTDALVCIEMPFFAFAHQYAFSTVDFVDPHAKYVARMPMGKAFRDAFGLKDVVEDCKVTLRGEGMDYREFEPSEGFMHQGAGRDRRIRAGLRYSQGGKRKYWLPQPITSTRPPGVMERRVNRVIERVTGRDDQGEEVHAPLLPHQAQHVVHLAPDLQSPSDEDSALYNFDPANEGYELPFGDTDPEDEELFRQSKKLLFGDYNYPVVDVSNESARILIWTEEERILHDERGAYFSPILGPGAKRGYGAMGNGSRSRRTSDLSDSDRARGKAPQRSGTPPVREVVIDKETDRLAIADSHAGDVHLQWAKLGGQSPARSPRIRKLSNQGKAGSGLASSAGSSSSSPASSPHNRPPPSPRKDSERPSLPPDAVDLVVEDRNAANEESAHERRRGEPQGLRKVYRRGYVVDDEEGQKQGEVEVDAQNDESTPFTIGDDVDAILETEETAVEDMTATRAETPPAHAQIVVDNYDELHEHNPWA